MTATAKEPINLREEIMLIFDRDVREFVIEALKDVPPYFWTVSASTSGDFHPLDERGDQGLLLHTKRVVKLVTDLFRAFKVEDVLAQSCLYASAILHDTFKSGITGRERRDDEGNLRTDPFHAIYPRRMLQEARERSDLEDWQYDKIMYALEGHGGVWSPSPFLYPYHAQSIRNMDVSDSRVILHIADYIASRKYVKIDVD